VYSLNTCNKKPVQSYMCIQGRWQFNMQYVRSMTHHQLVSITCTLTKPNTKLKLRQNKIYLVQNILKARGKMFVTAILFNGTEPKCAKVFFFIYMCNCSHQWTHDDFCMFHKVDLQLNKDRNVIILRYLMS